MKKNLIPVVVLVGIAALSACASQRCPPAECRWLGQPESELRSAWGRPSQIQSARSGRAFLYPADKSSSYRFELDTNGRIISVSLVSSGPLLSDILDNREPQTDKGASELRLDRAARLGREEE